MPSGILMHAAIWPQQVWAENSGRLCPLGEGDRARSPPNTMWTGQRPTCSLLAKFHLDRSNGLATIHQRHRQTGQTDRTGKRSDSIGWTVLQTFTNDRPKIGQHLTKLQAGKSTARHTLNSRWPRISRHRIYGVVGHSGYIIVKDIDDE